MPKPSWSLIRQYCEAIIYGVVVTGLVVAALCNATYLLDEYINKNIATSVTLKSDEDNIGFLENVSIFLRNDRTIFPELWSAEEQDWMDEQMEIMQNTTNFNASFFLDKHNSSKLSLEGMYRMAYLMGEIWWGDHNAMYYGFADTPRTYPQKAMRRFLDLPQVGNLTSMLEKDLLDYAYERMDISGDDHLSEDAYFSPDLVHPVQFTFVIPLQLQMSRTKNQVRFKIGGSPALERNMSHKLITKSKNGSRSSPDFNFTLEAYSSKTQALNKIFGPYSTDLKHTVEITVHIINMNIFDTTRVRSKESCDVCGALTDVEDCIILCKAQSFVDTCNCRPFLSRKYLDNSTISKVPYCTWQNYAKCFNETSYKSLTKHCTPKQYLPCEIVTNNYIAQVTTVGAKDSFFDLRFWVDKTVYVVFKGKKKNSFLEMLGQLGGNLGLFLSFSLLGVLQFFFFIYKSHKRGTLMERIKRKSPRVSPVSQDNNNSLWSEWIRTNWLSTALEFHQADSEANQGTDGASEKCQCDEKVAALMDEIKKLRKLVEERVKSPVEEERDNGMWVYGRTKHMSS